MPHRVLAPSADSLREVAAALLAGELVVIPTDTVYGLAAMPTAESVSALFRVKGRPETRAIPVLLSGTSALVRVAASWPWPARVLTRHFWPGALTVVVTARDDVPSEITAGTGTVGLRVPACDVTRTIIGLAGGVLAVTSANRSGQRAATSVGEAVAALDGSVAWFVDGGVLPVPVPSTVVEVREHSVRVLRQGAIDFAALRQTIERDLPGVEFIVYGGE